MNRSVLIVTPHFAPQSHAAVFRAHKLAKYLPCHGWKPFVLTVDTNYQYNEDEALLAELPPEVEIHRARYVEPTLRGVRMALRGAVREAPAQATRGLGLPVEEAGYSLARRLYLYTLQRWIQVPDAYCSWVRPAVRLGRRLQREHRIPIVYTTCPPYSSNVIGMVLRNSGSRWIADIRDPIGYARKNTSGHAAVAARQARITEDTLRLADVVVTASAAFELILRDMFPDVVRDIRFVPTGLDEALLPPDNAPAPRPFPYLIFAGEFLPEYDDVFLQALRCARQDETVRSRNIKVLVAGHARLNPSTLGPRLRRYQLEDVFEFLPHLPQGEIYHLIRGAKAGLLIPGRSIHWWCHFAKMVDYIALRKPVLAVVPDPSEARSALTKAGLGVFLDGSTAECARRLSAFLLSTSTQQTPSEDECTRHTARKQVESFVEIFEEMREKAAS